MNQSSDIMFMAEYIKNVLYFATVRQGKTLKNTVDTHYFSIDNELVYENYYSDFGPLNLGCVYKYCRILSDKITQYLNKQIIVHYTSVEPKKKANSAFLLGCYGVLYLSLTPRDALKPLLVRGQNYRPFQDVTQGDSAYTISIMDCLQAIKKARDLGFFNFQDFNFEEYNRLDKIHGGDLNWIVPGKFLAFIGPVDTRLSLYHPPEMYIDYFLDNNVKIVIRLNKRMYDGEVFNKAGILHYDLFFPDGSHPPRHIMFKFLQISEDADCAIAVHCKAGLGRTGSLIGSYLIKHYRMTSHEAIGWMRICRPGSVIGHQQAWLEKLEAWLIKQGNIYRKRIYQDTEKLPYHEFGIYSFAEKTARQQSLVLQKTPSPPLPVFRPRLSNVLSSSRPQNSRTKEDKSAEDTEDEMYIASCDLTVAPTGPLKQMKGCVLTSAYEEERDIFFGQSKKKSGWRKYLRCQPCFKTISDGLFMLAVRCASIYPDKCYSFKLCSLIDLAAEKERDWRLKFIGLGCPKLASLGDQYAVSNISAPQCSGSGDPKILRPAQNSTPRSVKDSGNFNHAVIRGRTINNKIQAPQVRSVDDARNYVRRTSFYANERENGLRPNITAPSRTLNLHSPPLQAYNAAPKVQPPQTRRRLGRSPSPPPNRTFTERNKATNTPSQPGKIVIKEITKSALKDVFSRFTCKELVKKWKAIKDNVAKYKKNNKR